ncbi:MAG: iron-sulfur cluster assembly accessory protein [Deltaproteobacteria bacterium]|nr:iron-sulfur cluster assembly accessory protein [Deltaproteobacteria bacterium]
MSNTTQQAQPEPKPESVKPESAKPESAKLGITITQSAVDAIAIQIAKRNVPETSLRVGIRGGGCSGFSYVIEFHDGPPRSRDTVYDLTATNGDKVRVVVDKKSLLYLNGSSLEWEKTLMRQGFKFVNPNEKASCGCGTSFTV